MRRIKKSSLTFLIFLGLISECLSDLLIPLPRDANLTRSKRQLFRDDIPHHRPLSGNLHALNNGFPQPGRWSDGTFSPYKPNHNLPPPHQDYFDMLDGAKPPRYNKGVSLNNEGVRKGKTSFFNEIVHSGGGISGSEFNTGFDAGEKVTNFNNNDNYEPPSYVNVQIHSNYPEREKYTHHVPEVKDEGPKTIVHIHPVEYSPILNIPHEPQPPKEYGPGPPYYPPSSDPPSYGPPGHISGPPIGELEGGFIPSRGIPHHHEEQGHYNVPRKPEEDVHPYRFQPFKFFPPPRQSPPKSILDEEVPIAIPILAQFHTSRPIRPVRPKEPLPLIYRKRPQRPYGPRRPGFLRHRPELPLFPPPPPPDWSYRRHH